MNEVQTLFVILILGFVLGVISMKVYSDWNNRTYDGLYFSGNYTHPQALEKAQTYDYSSDWICVNVYKMDYKRAVQVCSHEVGHELWAEICEYDDELCLKGQELLNNYTNKNG